MADGAAAKPQAPCYHFLAKCETANPYQHLDADNRTVGSGDYLAPEQILSSDRVDARADIYSLGATLYFLLTGNPPFPEASLDHHKLIWHLTRRPRPVRDIRPDVPPALAALVEKMIAKNPWDRYQSALEVAKALAPWTRTSIPPPPESEMLRPSLAVELSAAGKPVVEVGW
jgi:serine/threonine protein kinase